MKSFKLFATLRLSIMLLAFVLIVSSCDNEEDGANPRLISISAPENFVDYPVYVIASSTDGEVIAFDQLTNGETTTLTSTTYTENSFVLSVAIILDDEPNKYFYATSYIGITRGIEIAISTGIAGSINLNTSGFEQNPGSYSIASNGEYGYLDSNNEIEALGISKDPTRLFIVKSSIDNQQHSYLFPSTTYTNGQTANLNLAGNYSTFTSETITLSEETFTGVSVFGRPSTTDFTEKYLVSESYDYGNQLTIKYPGSTFPAYASESYIQGDTYTFTAYNKSSRSDFSMFSANAEIEVNNQVVNYDITSDGKIVVFEAEMEGSNQFEELQWEIYAPAGSNQSFVLPQIPEEIKNLFDSYNYSNWVFNNQLGVLLPEGVNSVTDYLTAETDGSLFSSKNVKYLNLYLDSNTTRGDMKSKTVKKQKLVSLFDTKSRLERHFLSERK